MNLKLLLALFCVLGGTILAQVENDFVHYYRNSYTPVETSLGGMTSFMNPSVFSHNINPAILLNNATEVGLTYRHNNLAYYGKEQFNTFNATVNFMRYGAFGISYTKRNPEFDSYILLLGETNIEVFKENRNYLTVSYSNRIFPNFVIGMSYNRISNQVLKDRKLVYESYDVAMMYESEFEINKVIGSRIVFAMVIDNLVRSGEYEYFRTHREPETTMLDQNATVTLSNQYFLNKQFMNKRIATLNLQFNYTDKLDDDFHSYFALGMELNILERLTLRYAYSEGREFSGIISPTLFYPMNSFGFGIELPISEISETDLPLSLKFDYGHTVSYFFKGYEFINFYPSDINVFSFGIKLEKF